MKATILLRTFLLLALSAAGCSTFTTEQKDKSYAQITNGTTVASVPLREVSTTAKARTFWDSKSALANFKATQTDKSQNATVGSLNQEASSTNLTSQLDALARILQALRPTP